MQAYNAKQYIDEMFLHVLRLHLFDRQPNHLVIYLVLNPDIGKDSVFRWINNIFCVILLSCVPNMC